MLNTSLEVIQEKGKIVQQAWGEVRHGKQKSSVSLVLCSLTVSKAAFQLYMQMRLMYDL